MTAVSGPLDLSTACRQAADAAAAAAADAGVSVELVHSAEGAHAAATLVAAVWARPSGESAVPTEIARALSHSGNYVSIARRAGAVVGATVGFRAADEHGPFVHSHVAGVVPGLQGRHVGFAMKQHQRAWTLEQGLDRMTWTFDPLVVRNAYFNVTKLGATLGDYLVDFYGPLDDEINSGGESDRCLVQWHLASPSAVRAAAREGTPTTSDRWKADGAVVVLEPGDDGAPRAGAAGGDVLLGKVPDDIVELRRRDPHQAGVWRKALRSIFLDAAAGGWGVATVTRDGWYVFERA